MLKNIRNLFKGFVLILVIMLLCFFVPKIVFAEGLSTLSDTMSRMEKSVGSNHTIRFTTPTGAGDVGDTIEITMPTGFTIGSVNYTDIDLSHGASTGYETEETLAESASDTAWGASFSGQVLSLEHPTNASNGDIAASDKVIVEIGTNADAGDQQITNHATAATYIITIGGDFGDSGNIAIVILDDDQFSVDATVDPSLTFSISATSTSFGTLNDSTVTTSSPSITAEISTNAANGYTIKISDAGNSTNPGLYNSDADFLIGSANYSYGNSADLSSVAGYGIQASSATATIASPYNVSGDNVGGYELTAQNLATYDGGASSHQITVTSKAKVTGATPAGTYNDTVTIIAVGNF